MALLYYDQPPFLHRSLRLNPVPILSPFLGDCRWGFPCSSLYWFSRDAVRFPMYCLKIVSGWSCSGALTNLSDCSGFFRVLFKCPKIVGGFWKHHCRWIGNYFECSRVLQGGASSKWLRCYKKKEFFFALNRIVSNISDPLIESWTRSLQFLKEILFKFIEILWDYYWSLRWLGFFLFEYELHWAGN